MLGLRQEKGVSLEKLQNYGCALLNKKEKVIGSLKEKNIIKLENGHVKLCPEFYGVCNAVVLELID